MLPCRDTRPASGRTSPLMMRRRVLLPAPLGPMTPMHSPRCASKETSRSAQNSVARKCDESALPKSRAPKSIRPFVSARLGERLNFLARASMRSTLGVTTSPFAQPTARSKPAALLGEGQPLQRVLKAQLPFRRPQAQTPRHEPASGPAGTTDWHRPHRADCRGRHPES